jgi:hypothetical protein
MICPLEAVAAPAAFVATYVVTSEGGKLFSTSFTKVLAV